MLDWLYFLFCVHHAIILDYLLFYYVSHSRLGTCGLLTFTVLRSNHRFARRLWKWDFRLFLNNLLYDRCVYDSLSLTRWWWLRLNLSYIVSVVAFRFQAITKKCVPGWNSTMQTRVVSLIYVGLSKREYFKDHHMAKCHSIINDSSYTVLAITFAISFTCWGVGLIKYFCT